MLARLQRPQADRRHTWTYSYAPAGRQAAYEPHGSRSGRREAATYCNCMEG